MVTASSESMSRTPSATVRGASSSRISSRTGSSTSVSAREVEIEPKQFDQARPLLGFERLDHRAEVGFVQVADQPAQRLDVRRSDGLDHAPEIPLADGAVVVARQRSDFSFCHAGSAKLSLSQRACSLAPQDRQTINDVNCSR